MRPNDDLSHFVRQCLSRGITRCEINTALTQAGWTPIEAAEALAAWADAPRLPPVPRPRTSASARDSFGYSLLFLALAMVSGHLVALAFSIIEALLPDVACDPQSRSCRASLDRWSMAALVVFTPLLLWLSARMERETSRDPGRRRSGLRQGLAHLTLMIVAVCLLGDLLATVYALLSGEMTMRFLLKALTVAGIAGISFAFVSTVTRKAPLHAAAA